LDGNSLQSPTNLFAVRRKLSELLINKYNFRTTWIFDRTGTWHPLGISNGTDSNSTNIVAVKHVWRQTPIAVRTRIQGFSSHLRQQNRDILAYLTAKLLLSRLKRDIKMPLLSTDCPVCVKLWIVCQGESIYGRTRGSIHIARVSVETFQFPPRVHWRLFPSGRASHPSMPLCYAKRYADFGRATWMIRLIFQPHDIFIKLVTLSLSFSISFSLFRNSLCLRAYVSSHLFPEASNKGIRDHYATSLCET